MTSMASSIQPSWAAASARHCRRVMASYQRMEPLLLLAQQGERLFEGDAFEADLVARAKLADRVHVGGNDVGDLGVAAGGLVLDEEEDGAAVRRHLHGAEGDAFGEHVPGVAGERRTIEAQAHAVGLFGDAPGGGVERL